MDRGVDRIKTIVCTGDSHTWGQGAAGLAESFENGLRAGDLRLAGFEYGCYVNLLRRMVCAHTDSTAYDIDARRLQSFGGRPAGECVAVGQKPLVLPGGDLVRLEFQCMEDPSRVRITAGDEIRELSLQNADAHGAYRISSHFYSPSDVVSVEAAEGEVLLYRTEHYSGKYAVINSGVGSCPTHKYAEQFFPEYVAAQKPHAVLMQAHTINDWLTGKSPKQYGEDLVKLVSLARREGALAVLLTVSPILGNQKQNGCSDEYIRFIEESRHAAKRAGIALADAHARMLGMTSGCGENEIRHWMYTDNWHVNDLGHAIYAQQAWLSLTEKGIIEVKER